MDLCAVFIDLVKASDAVNREALWVILAKLGCPRKFNNLIRLFHEARRDCPRHWRCLNTDRDHKRSETGRRPGSCVIQRDLMLTPALHDIERGVYLCYRLGGSLLDLRKLNAKTKTLE